MGIRLMGIAHAKQKLQRTLSARIRMISATSIDVPKGHFAVYVGEFKKRFVIPIAYLNYPLFQDLLNLAEEEFGLAWLKKNLDMTIPWVVSLFHAVKNTSSV